MAEEWLNKTLESLGTKSSRLYSLNEINKYLEANPNVEIEITNRLLCCQAIYDCLDDEIDVGRKIQFLLLVGDILRTCMEKVSLKQECNLGHLLHRALTNKWTRIKILALNTIERKIGKLIYGADSLNVSVTDVVSLELFHHILLVLRDHPENRMGVIAFQIFSHILDYYLDEPSVKEALKEIFTKDNVVLRFRVFERICRVGLDSKSNFRKIKFMLDYAAGELERDNNNLLHVNILEAIVVFADIDYGVKYFERNYFFDILADRVGHIEYTPQNLALILSIIKFLSGVCRFAPRKIITVYPCLVFRLVNCLCCGGDLILPTIFEAIVDITCTQDGVYCLERTYPHVTQKIFVTYSNYLKTLPHDLRVTALESLETIFARVVDVPATLEPGVKEIFRRWFKYLNRGKNNMVVIAKCCRHHCEKIRASALYVVRAACYYTWGIEALKNTPQLFKQLLDRSIGNFSVRFAKCSIIAILFDSGEFDAETNEEFSKYLAEYGGEFDLHRY